LSKKKSGGQEKPFRLVKKIKEEKWLVDWRVNWYVGFFNFSCFFKKLLIKTFTNRRKFMENWGNLCFHKHLLGFNTTLFAYGQTLTGHCIFFGRWVAIIKKKKLMQVLFFSYRPRQHFSSNSFFFLFSLGWNILCVPRLHPSRYPPVEGCYFKNKEREMIKIHIAQEHSNLGYGWLSQGRVSKYFI
jgi:hypothetical protein